MNLKTLCRRAVGQLARLITWRSLVRIHPAQQKKSKKVLAMQQAYKDMSKTDFIEKGCSNIMRKQGILKAINQYQNIIYLH